VEEGAGHVRRDTMDRSGRETNSRYYRRYPKPAISSTRVGISGGGSREPYRPIHSRRGPTDGRFEEPRPLVPTTVVVGGAAACFVRIIRDAECAQPSWMFRDGKLRGPATDFQFAGGRSLPSLRVGRTFKRRRESSIWEGVVVIGNGCDNEQWIPRPGTPPHALGCMPAKFSVAGHWASTI